jgi:hypothetical protein
MKNKKAKSKRESGVVVITTSPKQELATVKILGLAPNYKLKIVNAPEVEGEKLVSDGQRAVRKQFGDPQKPDVAYSMWANTEAGERVLAVLKPAGDALSIKAPNAAIRTVKI